MNKTNNLPKDEFGNIDVSKLTDLQKFFYSQEIEKQKTAEKIEAEKRKLKEKEQGRVYELEAVLRKTVVNLDKIDSQIAKAHKTVESKKESLLKSEEKLVEYTRKKEQLKKDVEEVRIVLNKLKGNNNV